jgi:hypothetical protein
MTQRKTRPVHDDPEGLEADAEALAASRLDEHIRRVVKTWPPFTPEQRAKLAVLLAPSREDRGRAA